MPTTLPTPESRTTYMLELHHKAIALTEYMRAGGLPIGALAPYGAGPIAVEWRHYEHGSVMVIEGADSKRSISVSTHGALVGEPLAWTLVLGKPEPPYLQRTVHHIEAVERATQLLTRIGQLVVYPDALEFAGPNFKPDVTQLSNAVQGTTGEIEITPDLRAHLDEYRLLVTDTSRPGVLLPTEERRRKLVWRSGMPLEIRHGDLREHVLQALRFYDAEATRWRREVAEGQRRVSDRDHSRYATSIAAHVFARRMSTDVTHQEVHRVAGLLTILVHEGLVASTDEAQPRFKLASDPLMSDDSSGADHIAFDGHVVSVAWLCMLPMAYALEYLQDACDLSPRAACHWLAYALASGATARAERA